MKKSIYTTIAAIFALAGCMKPEAPVKVETKQDAQDSYWVFVSQKPAFDDETKTAWTGEKVEWQAGDKIRVACYNSATGIWQDSKGDASGNPKAYASNQLTAGDIVSGVASFSLSTEFDMPQGGDYRFYSFYPDGLNGGKPDLSKVTPSVINAGIANSQEINSVSFGSQDDILVGLSTNTYTSKPAEYSKIELKWKRLVAFPVITFKGLKDAEDGEKVLSVKLAAQDGAVLTGSVNVDIKDGTIAGAETGTYNYVSATNTDGVELDANKSFTTWFTTLPFTATSLSVEIQTSKAKYTRTIDLSSNQKTFERNKRNLLTVNMSSAERTENPVETKMYVKVTSTSDLTDGKYLIVYETGKVALDGALTSDVPKNTVAVTISDNKIASTAAIDAAAVTYSASNGSFLGGGGKYIGHTGSSNTLNYSDSALENEVTIDDNDNAVIKEKGKNYSMQFNKNSGQERFRYFTTVQQPIQLYKLDDGKQTQTLTFPKQSYEVTFGDDFTAPTVSGNQTTVTYTSSNTEVAIVNASTGAVTIIGKGSTIITASAEASDTYRAASASYNLVVKGVTYGITINDMVNGSVTADPEKAEEGETVTLTITPDSGYELDELTVSKTSGTVTVTDNKFTMPAEAVTVSATFKVKQQGDDQTFTISSAEVVGNTSYTAYTETIDKRNWLISFGGNNKSVGTNSSNRSKCNLSSDTNTKYAVSPVATSDVASVFACTTKLTGVKKINYTVSGGSNQTSTNVYVIYSADGNTFSQIALTSGTQGAALSSGTTFEFASCDGYFAVLFKATNTSGNWRIDDVNLTFTYSAN